MYKCKIITYCSYFEPVFQGEKSRLFILQQCIIYLNYLIADTSPFRLSVTKVGTGSPV